MPVVEKHWAIVTDNNDDMKQCRLKVECQTLVGAGTELPDWIPPGFQTFTGKGGGSAHLPSVGDQVEIEVVVSDWMDERSSERMLQNPSIRWFPAPPSIDNGPAPLPAPLTTNYPERRGNVSPKGHYIIIDDTAAQIVVQTSNGFSATIDDKNKQIVLQTKNGLKVVLSDNDNKVYIGDQSGSDDVALATATKGNFDSLHSHLQAIEAVITGPSIPEAGLGAPSAFQAALAIAVGSSPLPTPNALKSSIAKAK